MKNTMRRTAKIVQALGVMAALARCSGSDEPPAPVPLPTIEAPKLVSGRLGTRGAAFVDEIGRTVILRGVNVGGRSKMPPFLPFDFADPSEISGKATQLMSAVRALGANAIRLTFSWEALEPVRGTFDAEYVARFRTLLDAAQQADLRAVVDFHQDVFHASFCGDGFPEWALGDIPHAAPHYDCAPVGWASPYFDPASGVSQAFDGLWGNRDGLLDQFEAMWRHVAHEIGRHPAVAAFDVINEPGYGSQPIDTVGSVVLPNLYDRIAATIEAEVGQVAIFGEDPVSTTPEVARLARPQHPRFAYAPHFYDFPTTAGLPFDRDRARNAVLNLLSRGDGFGAPVFLGEFGIANTNAAKVDLLTTVLDSLDERHASGTMWEASVSGVRWNSEDLSVFRADGSEQDSAGTLDRPFPRAVDGTVTALTWDSTTKRFDLSVDGEGDKVSEVYLPVRHLGRTPRITVTGARWRWLPDTGRLLIASVRGGAWSLVAEAAVAPFTR